MEQTDDIQFQEETADDMFGTAQGSFQGDEMFGDEFQKQIQKRSARQTFVEKSNMIDDVNPIERNTSFNEGANEQQIDKSDSDSQKISRKDLLMAGSARKSMVGLRSSQIMDNQSQSESIKAASLAAKKKKKIFTMGKSKGSNLIEPSLKKQSTKRKSRIGDISERSSMIDTSSKNDNASELEEDFGEQEQKVLEENQLPQQEMNNIQEEKNEESSEEEQSLSLVIGTKKYDYKQTDPIFQVKSAVPPLKDEKQCIFCEKDTSKLEPSSVNDDTFLNCEFCGHLACNQCCYKKRNFYQSPHEKSMEKTSGMCCKICDRKFLQRQISNKLSLSGRSGSLKIKEEQQQDQRESPIEELNQSVQIQQNELKKIEEKESLIKQEQEQLIAEVEKKKQIMQQLKDESKNAQEYLQDIKMDYQVEKMTVGQLISNSNQINQQVEAELSKSGQQKFQNELEKLSQRRESVKKEQQNNLMFLQEDYIRKSQYQNRDDFDAQALLKQMEKMNSYERMDFICQNLKLDKNKNANKNIDFTSTQQIMQYFEQESAANLSKKQVEFIMQAVYIDANFEKNLGQNKAGQDSISTHLGDSVHIKGLGAGQDFGKIGEMKDKFVAEDTNTSQEIMNHYEQYMQLNKADDRGILDNSTERIHDKMKKKIEKKSQQRSKTAKMLEADQQCCHDKQCFIF